jgi:hypothetical protein
VELSVTKSFLKFLPTTKVQIFRAVHIICVFEEDTDVDFTIGTKKKNPVT